MLPIQRKNALIEFLSGRNAGTIKELSLHLGVSEMTIRRDLKLLEEEGVVQRSHGGAVIVESPIREPAFIEKESRRADVKQRIASFAAAHYVTEGDAVILEGGTTATYMAPFLSRYGSLTVITNGLNTLTQLKASSGRHTVLSCGGMLRDVSGTFVGPVAESFFQQVHVKTLFLSASGFTPGTGFTDPNMQESQVKKAMAQAAEQVVMLVDSSKFGQRSFITTLNMKDISAVITDTEIPREIADYFAEIGIELHIV